MLTKERLKLEQPIAYKILENSLLTQKYAHAYLLNGEKGTPKMETAILLAQSILCTEGNGFACEICDTCVRIKNHTYTDCRYIDGETTSIKKNDILELQEEFNKTAVEMGGKKVYIMNYAENATPDALNSLLKFLEEPTNDLLAILIVEQIDRLLPTIISRCQMIPFRKVNVKEVYELCVKENMNSLDAYLLSHLVGNKTEIEEMMEDESYQKARILAMQMLEDFTKDKYLALYHLQKDGFKEKKGIDKQQFMQFMHILTLFYKDVIRQQSLCVDESWNQLMKKYQVQACIQYLKVCNETMDKCGKSVNLNLLVDQLLAQLKEMR